MTKTLILRSRNYREMLALQEDYVWLGGGVVL